MSKIKILTTALQFILILGFTACSGVHRPESGRDVSSVKSESKSQSKSQTLKVTPLPPILEEDTDQNIKNIGVPGIQKTKDRFVGIFNNPYYSPLLDLIPTAKKTIDIEIYMMSNPTLRAELRDALSRGVIIRVVKDPNPLGEMCLYFESDTPHESTESTLSDATSAPTKTDSPDCLDQKKLVSEIREHKGSFVPFNKTILCGQQEGESHSRCFEHGKMVLIDRENPEDRLALISTGNFNDSNLCDLKNNPTTCNRDYSYITRDSEVITGLTKVFENDLHEVRYTNDNPSLNKKMTVSPFSKAPLIELIKSAHDRIQIQNQYMKDPDINQALMDAAQHGVTVEMMVASDCAFGPPPESAKVKLSKLYTEMEKAGIKLKFFTSQMKQKGKNGYLHAKAIVVDEQKAWIGSVNGSTTSLDVNREYGIFFTQINRVQWLSQGLSRDFTDKNSETWQESFICKKDKKSKIGGARKSAH